MSKTPIKPGKSPMKSMSEVHAQIQRIPAKTSISEDIAEQIMTLISTGQLSAGQRLPSERELCITFGVGRSSLREALRCLSIVGVLNARVGEGTTVALDGGKFLGKIVEWRLISEKPDVVDLLEVRVALEGVAAAKSALQSDPKLIEKLEELIDQMRSSLGDANKFAIFDLDFHLTVARASDNRLLLDLISLIRGQLVRSLTTVLSLPHAVTLSLKEHIAILRAVKRGDADGARSAMHAHLEAALKRYKTASADKS